MGAIRLLADNSIESTQVTFPAGSVREEATVVAVLPDTRTQDSPNVLIITDRTPFHPRDPLWPDQPDDRGCLILSDGSPVPVPHSLTIARRPHGPIMIDEEIDAKRSERQVLFLVAHVVSADRAAGLSTGTRVGLSVDADRRLRLSAAHTACHLLAYSLNETTHGLWRKDAELDSRGHRDFDAASCIGTSHDVDGSRDEYRLGKSLRRRGFDTAAFLEQLPAAMAEVNHRLCTWIAADATVTISVAGPRLSDRRQWHCFLPEGTAQMPCGGTHVARLGQIASMSAQATYDHDAGRLRIVNKVHVAVSRRAHS